MLDFANVQALVSALHALLLKIEKYLRRAK